MGKYTIIIEETLVREIEVDAEDIGGAIEVAEESYNSSTVILDADDFVEVKFIVKK